MPHYEVRIAPHAQVQLDEAASWWKANRLAAPRLILDEFEAVVLRLARAPQSGANYRQIDSRSVRRLLLPRCRYHIYYEIDEALRVVRIVACWHATRRRGPRL